MDESILNRLRDRITEVELQTMKITSGTVRSDAAPASQTVIALDTDPTVNVPAESIIGILVVSARVKVLVYPPRGMLIIGYVGGGDTGWIDVTAPADPMNPVPGEFYNGWANAGGAFAPIGYRRIGNKAYMRGRAAGGAGAITFLPESFWPKFLTELSGVSQTLYVTGVSGPASAGAAHTHGGGTLNAGGIAARIFVDATTGEVTPSALGTVSLDTLEWFLD